MSSPDPDQPLVRYPCAWDYTVIGEDEARLRAAVAEVLGGERELEPSRRSAKGRYLSFKLTVRVADEAERTRIWTELRGHADVAFVL